MVELERPQLTATTDSKTLWHGRYEHAAADTLRRLNDSLPFDRRFYAEDILGSQVWAEALAQIGLLTRAEFETIRDGLGEILREFERGEFRFAEGDEDIHTAVERRLAERIGAVAGKLHTGRSRNDQVATDFRLWVAAHLNTLIPVIEAVIAALIDLAEPHTATVMPGYTHLRAAQPITAGHWLLSYAEMIRRDRQKLHLTKAETLAECPLGSSALAGTPYPVNRSWIAEQLGFASPSYNSLDAVSDRDFVVTYLQAASLLMIHLSRFAEDVILYSSPQYGFIRLDERYTTGSSLMPQKQNPDILELARGKAGRISGHLTGFLTTYKGLPSTYNKDLQEDKEPVFDTADTLMTLLPALIGVIQTMTLNAPRMAAALEEELLATDIADYLVRKGVPFRESHGIVGRLVRRGIELNLPLSKLPIDEYQAISQTFSADVYAVFDFLASVSKRNNLGGTAPEQVQKRLIALKS